MIFLFSVLPLKPCWVLHKVYTFTCCQYLGCHFLNNFPKQGDRWKTYGGQQVVLGLFVPTPLSSNLDKYNWQLRKIHLAIWTNTFDNLDKYVWQFRQIHLEI